MEPESLHHAVGLRPYTIPGMDVRPEDPGHSRRLCWGELEEGHLKTGGHLARRGIWLRWEGKEQEAPIRVWVRYEGDELANLAPVLRVRKGFLSPLSRFINAVRYLDSAREALVELAPGVNNEVLLVELRHFPMYSAQPLLRELEEEDRLPLGDRVPVIASHGLLWDSPHFFLSGVAAPVFQTALRRNKRSRKLADKIKWYAFDYPSWQHPRQNGAALSTQTRKMLEREQTKQTAVLVGHSMGGLIQRYAMNHQKLGDQVRLAISAGSPHRGSMVPTVAAATGTLRGNAAGDIAASLREWYGYLMPDCPGARGLFWDDRDHAVSRPERADMELPDNPELARFNRNDAYQDRLICMAGDCRKLGLNRWISPHERLRWAHEQLLPEFGNCDPFVPLVSATFDGAPVKRSVHLKADHLGWALWSWQVDLLTEQIEAAV